uniref:Trichohyalin-plectin-homology domain-containing protein n=2 Tax=Dunaliella tertiolecta TaxID=3047 RepID=A0A6S8NDH6_DUNTE|mmetsp:Transcript_12075/g.33001  ORF Transcript_12075/g.33001 Transcript_12075/m.33001 type:complete len:468 (-) Transcript_12075:422-1825(-)|eukprot:CAMPEP_0202354972 /NCGR_PEP_ID=MMETSP1126-20121109/10060_1 /ASSEMBLY_ACC=CAM_ASM_000457 /TAXON_ID=3047 /ORGANISM="Dunaliella tertiolecta, Strain CCMP1320" /LENGTH=467 /DNA_ID=CAMNT_0048947509 /DNA_START=364 /DNA_END=1767 /DNA_ORIENTATION=-
MADMSLRGATCISRAHLDSIRSKVLEPHDDYNTERLRLKALSDERASKWPNTLQAGRARKERARLERAAAEENERIEADALEATLQAENRRVQIERANKVLFDETDKVKTLHGKMLESDAIKENEALVAYKKQIAVLRKAQDAAFVEQQRQALEAADAVELKKYEEARQRAMQQRDAQNKQLDELKAKILAERAADKKEGQLLKERAEKEAADLRAKELARIAKSKEHNEATRAANQALQAFKLKELERQKEQERAIEAYSTKKANQMAERAEHEAKKRAQKEAERKRIADAMEQNYINWHTKEEQLLERDVAAEEARKAAAQEAQRQRRAQQAQAAADFNRLQLQRKAEQKARSLAEDAMFAAAWQQRVKELKEEEGAEAAERLAEAKKLMEFQKHQVLMKSKRKAAAKMEELQEAAQIQLSLKDQDDIFKQYANECINEYASRGNTTVPLQRMLNKKEGLQPFMP